MMALLLFFACNQTEDMSILPGAWTTVQANFTFPDGAVFEDEHFPVALLQPEHEEHDGYTEDCLSSFQVTTWGYTHSRGAGFLIAWPRIFDPASTQVQFEEDFAVVQWGTDMQTSQRGGLLTVNEVSNERIAYILEGGRLCTLDAASLEETCTENQGSLSVELLGDFTAAFDPLNPHAFSSGRSGYATLSTTEEALCVDPE